MAYHSYLLVQANEGSLKVILSALWNLSAHCQKNKAELCQNQECLPFLIRIMRIADSQAVVESAGGILRNLSSFIVISPEGEKYR